MNDAEAGVVERGGDGLQGHRGGAAAARGSNFLKGRAVPAALSGSSLFTAGQQDQPVPVPDVAGLQGGSVESKESLSCEYLFLFLLPSCFSNSFDFLNIHF